MILRNQSFSDPRWFYGKKRKIGKGKNINFCEYVKFGAISLKIDILLITA